MNAHPILLVGRDRMLLQTRQLILGTYFDVESAGRLSEAGSLLSHREFELIIFCDTLSDAECEQIADMVRDQKPHPTLLALQGPGVKRSEHIGRRLVLPGGPLQLLRECANVLHVDLRTNVKQRNLPYRWN